MPQILMPALSPTMEEGKLAKWLVKVGDTVKSGDVLAEIETDKATMEVESVDEGVVRELLVAEGTEGVKVNTPIALVLAEGESAGAAPAPAAAEAPAPSMVEAEAPAAAPAAAVPAAPKFEAQADGRPAGTRVRSRCYFGAVEGVPAPAAEIEALAWMRHCDGIQGSQTLRLVLDHLLTERLID